VLVGRLRPRVYWYRFTDDEGNGAASGTITAPRRRRASGEFAFVSCQNVNQARSTRIAA
jgi:phosphodiesterase/alkaline phosphatase D-like protein